MRLTSFVLLGFVASAASFHPGISRAADQVDGIASRCTDLFSDVDDLLGRAFDEREELTEAKKQDYLDRLNDFGTLSDGLLDDMRATPEVKSLAWPFLMVGAPSAAKDTANGLLYSFPEIEAAWIGFLPTLYQCSRFVAASSDEVITYPEAASKYGTLAGWEKRRLQGDIVHVLRSMEDRDEGIDPLVEMLSEAGIMAAR